MEFTFGQQEGERREATRVEESLGAELSERVDIVVRLRWGVERRHFLRLGNKQRGEQFGGPDQFVLLRKKGVRACVESPTEEPSRH